MRRYSDRFLRIAFFIERSSKLTREWFRGTMLYTRHNPKWFVRMFELGNGVTEELLDFGTIRPDGIIACGVPARFLQKFFRERGMGDVPIMAFPQVPHPGIGCGCVSFDHEQIATWAIDLFKRRGCRHVVYVGAHLPNGVRLSRAFAKAFAAAAEKAGLPYEIPTRKVYSSLGIRVSECEVIMKRLVEYPKPCGILTYDDGIGRDILDLCRLANINVPASVCVLGMDDNALVCENANPSLSSIQLDYERTAFLAAKALDDMIGGRVRELPQLVCGMNGITERASTANPRGSGNLVALACDYIAKNACRRGGINQFDVAKHLGVSVRTLQLRFKESAFAGTILSEIQRVQLENVCRMLTTTKRTITEITFASGFGSLSRLKAIFAQKFGMSMRDYRNMAKNPPLKS